MQTDDPTKARAELDKAIDNAEATRACARCGRRLTDPTSIAAGMGPTCRQKATT